jgi:hypothetical protein
MLKTKRCLLSTFSGNSAFHLFNVHIINQHTVLFEVDVMLEFLNGHVEAYT